MTGSITPRVQPRPEVRFQPSMLSVPSSAATVAPEPPAKLPSSQRGAPASRRQLWSVAALSAASGMLVASLLNGPGHVSPRVHSGSPGFKQSPAGQDLHWEKKALTVFLDGSLQKLGPNASEAVMQAFGQWVASDARLPDLSFDTGKTSATPQQDGKSTVSYARITAPGHEHDVAITVTYANDKTGEIIEADVILNALYPMGVLTPKPTQTSGVDGPDSQGNDAGPASKPQSVHEREESMDCQNRYDAQNVTTHEAGHFFGLGEDPVERRATMFQTIDQCETHKRVLAATDISALGTLYAKSADPEEATAGARACSFGRVRTGGGALWLSAAIFGLGLYRRRRAR